MNAPFRLERKASPDMFNEFFLLIIGADWRRYKRYETLDQALQAYKGILNTEWNQRFDYRLQTPIGIITLPVVKARSRTLGKL